MRPSWIKSKMTRRLDVGGKYVNSPSHLPFCSPTPQLPHLSPVALGRCTSEVAWILTRVKDDRWDAREFCPRRRGFGKWTGMVVCHSRSVPYGGITQSLALGLGFSARMHTIKYLYAFVRCSSSISIYASLGMHQPVAISHTVNIAGGIKFATFAFSENRALLHLWSN